MLYSNEWGKKYGKELYDAFHQQYSYRITADEMFELLYDFRREVLKKAIDAVEKCSMPAGTEVCDMKDVYLDAIRKAIANP